MISYELQFLSHVSKSSITRSACSADTAKSFGYIVKSISVSSLVLKPTPSFAYSSKRVP